MKLEILYEDAYLLACVKPYGVLSQGDKGNDEDMITKIKHYLYDQEESEQAEEPYVAAIHRLDRPVGGVMVFAKTPEVAAKLSDMQQDGEIAKYYQAVITGELRLSSAGWKNEHNESREKRRKGCQARRAIL